MRLDASFSCSCKGRSDGRSFDLVVVGGGIVGLATAREVALRNPQMSIAVLEKEKHLGMEHVAHCFSMVWTALLYLLLPMCTCACGVCKTALLLDYERHGCLQLCVDLHYVCTTAIHIYII